MPRIDSTKTNLTGADLTHHVNGLGAYKGVDFSYMYCVRARFCDLDLTGCNFTGAELTDADFSGAILDGANFTDAFTRVQGEKGETFPLVEAAQLRAAKSLKGTILPDGTLADAPPKPAPPSAEDIEAKLRAEYEAKMEAMKQELEAQYQQAVAPKVPPAAHEPQRARR